MNSTMEHRVAAVGSVSLGAFLLIAQAAVALESSQREEIGRVIQEGMTCRNIPGLAMAVVKDGQVLMSEGYGVKDLVTGERVTSHTQFLVASLTKAFTATLLANVMAEHKMKISTNVYKTLQGGFKFNNTLRSVYATVEDLLAHRMGVPRNNYVRLSTDYSIQSFARKIKYLPSKGGFRDSFYYSDIMYGLSAYITEELEGHKPWKQQIRDTIFNQLGMSNSTFADDVDFDNDDVATPYSRENGQTVETSTDFIKHWGRNYGSGNIVSTASDLSRWMLMLLNQGRDSQGRGVLREGVAEDTFKPQNVLSPSYAYKYRKPKSPFSFTSDSYGLAWRLGYYKGYRMIHHSGSSFGYRAYLSLLPEVDVGVVTLMTGSDSQYQFRIALHAYLMDRALGHDPWLNSSTVCTYPDPWLSASASARNERSTDPSGDETPRSVEEEEEDDEEMHSRRKRSVKNCVTPNVTSSAAQKYVGTYHHAAYGNLSVMYNSTARALVLEYGIGLWCLEPTGEKQHDFEGKWLKDPPTLNMDFTFESKGDSINAVKATSFERKSAPVFRR